MREREPTPIKQDVRTILAAFSGEGPDSPGEADADFMRAALRHAKVTSFLHRAGDLWRRRLASDPTVGLYPERLESTDAADNTVSRELNTDTRDDYLAGLAHMATFDEAGGITGAYRRFRAGISAGDVVLARQIHPILCPPAEGATVTPLRPHQNE